MILFHDCWSGLGHFELWECSCPANNHQLTMALMPEKHQTCVNNTGTSLNILVAVSVFCFALNDLVMVD